MVQRLAGSKFGEGIGGTVSSTDDANVPSFDPATHITGTDKKIEFLLSDHTLHLLNQWEKNFLMDVYGKAPMTRKMHLKVAAIFKKYTQRETTT